MDIPNAILRALRLTLALWLITVVVLTLPMLGLARLVAPHQAAGSLLRLDGQVVGSSLIGQPFSSARYLQSRPSGNPNLAPSNPALVDQIGQNARRWRSLGLQHPAPELLEVSASGVDPHLGLAAARQQFPALAKERGLPIDQLEALLRRHRQGPRSGAAIEPVVNVLAFNLELDHLSRRQRVSQAGQAHQGR